MGESTSQLWHNHRHKRGPEIEQAKIGIHKTISKRQRLQHKRSPGVEQAKLEIRKSTSRRRWLDAGI